MEHNDIRHKLSEYIDGSITAEERIEIEAHLKTCRECSDALSELQKTIEQIKAIEEIEPPAWMTQKIMAKVRTEAEEKRNIFQRLFYPLRRLPIQAVAVVFLAITAFYIYRNIQPAPGPSEAPIQEYAAGKIAAKDELAKANDRALRAKQVPQAQEYKTLDMKQEYEKPAPPALMNQPAAPAPSPAAPARTAEQFMPAKGEAESAKNAVPQAGAPAMMQDHATGSALHPEKKFKAAAPMGRALRGTTADAVGSLVSVRVKNIDAAVRELEQTVKQLGGSIQKKDLANAKTAYETTINTHKLQEFKEMLKRIGEVRDEPGQPVSQDGQIVLRIEFVLN